jgi:7-cyano-7-deazaguanine synthase in queuosine biosynthesis
MRTIIGNSGGLDSTYALWKLLSTTNDDVTVVLLNTDDLTPQARQKFDVRSFNSAQSNATRMDRVRSIVDWLNANVRPCTLIEVRLDETVLRRGVDHPNNPQTVIVDWAVQKINAGEADRVVVTTERENDGFSNGGTIASRAPGAIAARDRFVADATRGELSFILLDMNYHQAVALRELPANLLALTRSCDSPAPEPCGVCFKCSKRKLFAEAISEGKTDEDIRSYVALRSELPDGRWRSMKHWIAEDVSTCAVPANNASWEMPSWPQSVIKSDGAT